MNRAVQRDVVLGVLAGIAGGIVFGAAMQQLGMLVSIAGLVGSSVLGVGWGVHLVISAIVGAIFGGLFRYLPGGYAASLTGGVIYGFLWWLIGPLTLMPVLLRQPVVWSLTQAQATFPSLVGHLYYGAVTGLTLYALATAYDTLLHPAWLDAVPGLGIGPVEPTHRIVIVGGGFAGLAVAQRLNQIFARDNRVDVKLVSESNYLLFTPMLAEVASSSVEGRHISSPMRAFFPPTEPPREARDGISTDSAARPGGRRRVRFQHARIVGIDPAGRTVTAIGCDGCAPQKIPYDHLVLTLGSRPNYFDLPGMEDNAFTLKSLADAELLRDHVIAQFERADAIEDPEERRRLLTFVVAGGGFSGVETVADFASSALRFYPTIRPDETRFILIHAQDRILPEISSELAEYALQKLQARGTVLQPALGGTLALPPRGRLLAVCRRTGSGDPGCPYIVVSSGPLTRYVASLTIESAFSDKLLGPAVKGALAGFVGGLVFGAGLNALRMTTIIARLVGAESARAGLWAHLSFGILIGAGYGMLFGPSEGSAGRALGRSLSYGFIWWVIGPLSIMPLWLDLGLPWSLNAAHGAFALLIGHILYGGFTALSYHMLDSLLRALFSDKVGLPFSEEGTGPRGLRAIARGILGSIAGGLVFTVVMLHVGMLPRVAELLGTSSPVTGFIVHMTISAIIGVTYGLLFRHESYSFGAAAGWGVVYGLFWWALGGLTLFPMFLGGQPQWDLALAGQTFASLMGHIAYGVATAMIYYALAERHSHWWKSEPEQTPAERDAWRGEQAATPAPALWALSLVMVIALVLLFGQ